MKYYLIAGEASGDLHASNLMKALRKIDDGAEFRFLGGDLMQSAGGTLVRHYRSMAFMGIIPVILNIRTIARNMYACREDIRQYRPDAVILIDYPGFNLKIAKYVKTRLGIPVCYYISPKIWAWKQYRIKSFRRHVDKMLCILPFEKEFYKQMNYEIEYVGNPCVDAIAHFQNQPAPQTSLPASANASGKPILALLAGSRKQEIKDNLPTMLAISAKYPQLQAIIAGAPGIDPAFYHQYIKDTSATIVFNQTYPLLHNSAAALVTSGTATLETALFRVPQAVCYHTPLPSLMGFIFRRFFHIRYISLVNLILNQEAVKEFFADLFIKNNIEAELNKLINDASHRSQMLSAYDNMINQLGSPGASDRAARSITTFLQQQKTTIY